MLTFGASNPTAAFGATGAICISICNENEIITIVAGPTQALE
jgi:hypothetical protein